MNNFETLTCDDLHSIEGGSVLLTAAFVLVKVTTPGIIKAGITIAGSITAQKLLDRWIG